ncbi:DUF5343 domain-containing protein [Paenarthrobacter nitroguajacolicus]|uniref:DUF5343 domain-containing protein n=1 Tax=Paenarthrobacter nitroguajacolicus TaxID=211146 RepID=UPI003AEE12BA
MRAGYAPMYKRNEYVDRLDRKKLEGLIREVTGVEQGATVLRAIAGTFEALKQYADFNSSLEDFGAAQENHLEPAEAPSMDSRSPLDGSPLRFGYTININLPNTNDISVFNAIFKSLKGHLL